MWPLSGLAGNRLPMTQVTRSALFLVFASFTAQAGPKVRVRTSGVEVAGRRATFKLGWFWSKEPARLKR